MQPQREISHCDFSRRRDHGMQAGRGCATHMSELAAAGGTARRSCIRAPLYFHQYPLHRVLNCIIFKIVFENGDEGSEEAAF